MTVAEVFADMLKRAMERSLPAMDLLSAIDKLSSEPKLCMALYRAWVESNAEDPLLYAVYFNYAVLLANANEVTEARDALQACIKLKPDFYPPYINLGMVLERLGLTGEAVQLWYDLVNKLGAVNPESLSIKLTALKQIGRVLERASIDTNAEDALRISLELNQHQRDVLQHYLSLRQRQLRWPVVKPWANLTRERLLSTISPLTLGAYADDPLFQLGNAMLYNKHDVGLPDVHFMDEVEASLKTREKGRRLRIGYLSSDLREHAVGYLMAEVPELHDRGKVEVYSYYCGHKVNDQLFQKFQRTSDHWCDVSEMSDEDTAKRIIADGIDILVDLNGYTHGARTKMLAMRPAPIIANWLGYPGTMGSPYHNYIIGDEFIIPKDHEIYYSEKVVRLPCYQPNDRFRKVSEVGDTRADAGLPEDAMVYCSFNALHKISPFTWARWMEILKRVPNSVLWLLEGIESTNDTIRRLFAESGLEAGRLIFAKRKQNADHLARYPLADLFLDSTPYGAHTTASDSLWCGVPILTLAGRGFATRVCGSLATAAGVPEMVCSTSEEYVEKAVQFGLDRSKLKPIREKLLANRMTSVLFDTPGLVRGLERCYAEMWGDLEAGLLPRPDMTNLELYSEIGVELDKDDVEILNDPKYLDYYKERLAKRHRYSPLPPDTRLWSGKRK